jgi:hypothetical protein
MKKISRIMKFTIFMLLIGTGMIFAEEVSSQKARVSFEYNNATTERILNEIENQTDYLFLCNGDYVDMTRQVSVSAKETSVADVLTDIFEGTAVSFVMEGRHIVLTKTTGRGNETAAIMDVVEKQPNIVSSGNIRLRNETITRIIRQQGKRVTGVVKDATGEPVIGASVIETGTTNGTATDANGNFTLSVTDENATLTVRYIGYKPLNVSVLTWGGGG